MTAERAPRGRERVASRLLAALLLLAAASPSRGLATTQETAAATLPPVAPSEGPPEALRSALEAAQRGDLEQAIAQLEALRREGGAPAPALAVLGALYLEAARAEDALALLAPLAEEVADPAVLYNAARAAQSLGRGDEAVRYLERSVAIDGTSPAARELGLLRAARGEAVEALRLLRPWAAANPGDVEARLVGAYSAVALDRPDDAETLLAGLADDHAMVRLLRGRARLLAGDPRAALDLLRPLLADENVRLQRDARRAVAEAEMVLGRPQVAVQLLAGAEGGDPSATQLLARALLQAGQLDEALSTLQPLATAGGEPPVAVLRDYGRMLGMAGRHAEALPVLEEASRRDPSDKLALQALGQVLAQLGRRDEATRALERFREMTENEVPRTMDGVALDAAASSTERHLREALRLAGPRRGEEALAIARREAALAPDDPRPLLVESRILVLLGRADDALAAAESALRLAPDDADAWYQRGVVHMARRQLPAAEADFRRSLELSPEHTAAMHDLAVLLMTRGDRAEARALLERARALRPDDQRIAASLRQLDGGGSP
jgi:tetratricopeptide (TPR) repeat protein